MLLHDARREARFDSGELVLLADQDRSRWDAAQIARGRRGTRPCLRAAGPRAYVIQAAIASLHMDEPRDWTQIAALYEALVRLTGSAVVELNRAIAVAETDGGEAGAGTRRPARPRRLPVLPLDARRPAAPPRPSDEARRSTNARSSSRIPSPNAASCSGASRKSRVASRRAVPSPPLVRRQDDANRGGQR